MIKMMKLNFSDPYFIEEQLRYRCCYNYKTHCRYIVAILALTAVATVLSVCLALQTASLSQRHQQTREQSQMPRDEAEPGPVPGRSILSIRITYLQSILKHLETI